MHVHKKRRELNPSFFAHAFTVGLSVQRLDRANVQELSGWITKFIGGSADRAWLGYVSASTQTIRRLHVEEDEKQTFCVYDTGLADNPAHAEVGVAYAIEEADVLECRRKLMAAFEDGQVKNREMLLNGSVWQDLPVQLQSRAVPTQWSQQA